MCRWCNKYRKAERLADALEEAYGPGRPEKRGRKKRGREDGRPHPASESEETA
ncbi:MAG: hypothetical protein WBK88_01460 [Methanothrix sp.]